MPEPIEVTALHMADAISFLMRVASEAGLRNIALKLAGVRASLLRADLGDSANEALDEHSAPDALANEEELDERKRRH